MPAKLISGEEVSAQVRDRVAAQVTEWKEKHGRVPGLAVIIVGEREDSATYVRLKKKRATEVGIANFDCALPVDVTQEALIAEVEKFNSNPDVHGLLIQLPLPDHISEKDVIKSISPDKDVDGIHPENMGKLVLRGWSSDFVPCTPRGVVALLDAAGVAIEGKNAVVIGRSDIVGMPVSNLLLQRNATVTMCHSKTADLPAVVRTGDIVIAAAGRPEMVKGDWIKPGAAVIDVGTTPVDDPSKKSGKRLSGDLDFPAVSKVAGFVTKVPGGVGPMTIAMLLQSTANSFARTLPQEQS